MYFWNSYPFVRFTLILILGILSHESFPFLWEYESSLLITTPLMLAVSIVISSKRSFFKLRHLNGILAISTLFIIGGSISKFKNFNHPQNHYKHINSSPDGYSGIIISPPNERPNHIRFDLELESILLNDSIKDASGKIHIYIQKDSSSVHFNYGDKLLIYGSLFEIPKPDNPNEFDYQKYLERQNIFSHSFVTKEDVRLIAHTTPNTFLKFAYRLRDEASHTIDKYIQSSRENGIAKALLLGIKDNLESDTKKAYSAAGAMHVLAVSGLHVGIVFMIVQMLFGKIRQTGKWGEYLFILISILIIWLYACLTGLSPSVLRAATMFSFITIGQRSKSQGNIYNTLGFSAFVLLLFDPNLIYSVGFQLSYAAVVGIVYIQPILYRRLHFNYWLLDKAWAITCVSIAAQLATFPLSAFYFHQFPTYFLVSNLIVIPSSFLMLISGISMIVLDYIFSPLSALIGDGLSHFMWFLNEIIGYVHRLPYSLIEWIHIDKLGLLFIYLTVISFISSMHFRSFKTLILSSLIFVCLVMSVVISNEIQSDRKELVFYELRNSTAIDFINGHTAELYLNNHKSENLELLAFQINPHRLASHLRPIQETIREPVFFDKNKLSLSIIGGKRFVFFDSTTYHLRFNQVIDTDFVIINNQSVKSLKWLTQHFRFDQIIIGNENSYYYSQKMRKEAEDLGLKVHSLKEDGALRYSLNESIKKERTILSALFTTNPD